MLLLPVNKVDASGSLAKNMILVILF